jgi:hypothetical protein
MRDHLLSTVYKIGTELVRNGDASGTIAPAHGGDSYERCGGRRKGGNNHTDLRQMGAPATDLDHQNYPP